MRSAWGGHRGVLSLTFDDGLPCQLQHAIPMMDRHKLPGTFFIIDEPLKAGFKFQNDLAAWRGAASHGHELGVHSAMHKKAGSMLTDAERIYETITAKQFLEKQLDVPMPSYCYPYTDAPERLQYFVRQVYDQARGGRVARADKFIVPKDDVNIFNVPCYHINESVIEGGDAEAFVDAALERNAWVTFMFHAVGDVDGWDNVTTQTFANFMQFLAKRRDGNGLWIATFGDAAKSLREYQRG